jgi:hypothetical protein
LESFLKGPIRPGCRQQASQEEDLELFLESYNPIPSCRQQESSQEEDLEAFLESYNPIPSGRQLKPGDSSTPRTHRKQPAVSDNGNFEPLLALVPWRASKRNRIPNNDAKTINLV